MACSKRHIQSRSRPWLPRKRRRNGALEASCRQGQDTKDCPLCAFSRYLQKDSKFVVPKPLQSVTSDVSSGQSVGAKLNRQQLKSLGRYSSFPFPHLSPLSALRALPLSQRLQVSGISGQEKPCAACGFSAAVALRVERKGPRQTPRTATKSEACSLIPEASNLKPNSPPALLPGSDNRGYA
jgi:hypothetical protein